MSRCQGWQARSLGGIKGMSFAETISPFFGRCAFVWFYTTSAMDIVTNWSTIAADLTAKQVPLPPLVLLVVLLLIVMGSIALLFGWHTRHAAILLFGMTMIATVTMHDFWHFPEGAERAQQFAIFARDFAICGGLLLLVGLGPGPFAVDNRGKSGGGGKKR
ncbi:MAG TPA: DoxX family membrane protein [Rhizomicrobium sp.]|nr:DoxX family membrane protein [Rhizomicrobium sp.]